MSLSPTNPISAAIARKGESITAVAEVVGCDKGHLSRIVRLEANAGRDLADKLAAYLGIPREHVLYPADYPVEEVKAS